MLSTVLVSVFSWWPVTSAVVPSESNAGQSFSAACEATALTRRFHVRVSTSLPSGGCGCLQSLVAA